MVENQINENWQELLDSHFSFSPRDLPMPDAIVHGVVVANAPFGIYLDIGCGIPALLDIIHVALDDREPIPQWTHSIGTRLTAKVSVASDTEIKLHQFEMETW
jgi:hypothetical protein